MKEAENFPENIGTLLRVLSNCCLRPLTSVFINSYGFLNELKYPEPDSLLPYCMTDGSEIYVSKSYQIGLFFHFLCAC
jgi:hypothetical protein